MKNYLLFVAIILQTPFLLGQQLKNALDDGRKIKIPVVFHVIFSNEKENVSDSLILSELKDLNLDFVQKNDMILLDHDFQNLVGNPNLEFYLLNTSFQTGKGGIQRISLKKFKNRNELLIDPSNCLNVFIARQGNNTPTIGAENGENWVNLNYKDVGTNGHALTHETGHWLGLYHIFGQVGNSSLWNKMFGNSDDLIDDTPKQKGATAICYEIKKDCPCPPKNINYKNHKRLYNNFMDYNPCRCMFTIGQSIQMRNKIIENRRKLFDNSK
ncbi:M43 family zinc metalloprotease [Chryseobacterium gambrini]|uniref:M43 family zinc metalloprotease n=1 Tax=Chryseobacterium gambrini TaxID=373672 RepID=UPI0022F3F2CB|nr:M43 family zinc metalloprotease [Chryseobacterium gambrini]WBX99470.1 M43 family zinc metalloprotease [Chryseobacterium gambrini]